MAMKNLFLLAAILFTSLQGIAQTRCGFEGTWSTDWGPLTLRTSDGRNFSGSYNYNGTIGYVSAAITKTESDGKDALVTLKGTWRQGKLSGTFELSRVCSQPAFSGSWWNDNGKESGLWKGMQK